MQEVVDVLVERSAMWRRVGEMQLLRDLNADLAERSIVILQSAAIHSKKYKWERNRLG